MDRYLLINFLLAYAICFISMVGLYVVIDLFTNADEFLEDHPAVWVFLRRAGKYYLLHSFQYFNQLSPIITMIAAMTTLASLHRHNEIVALLAAGVPTRRALVPILIGALVMITLGVANRESFLPRYSERLQRLHEDIEAAHALMPSNTIDSDGVLLAASAAYREDQRLEKVNVTLPTEIVGQLQEIRCPNAYFRQDDQTGQTGWLLVDPSPVQILRPSPKLQRVRNNDLFLYSDVSFADMIRRESWMSYASTAELLEHLHSPEVKNPEELRTRIHNRLMQPVLNLVLVLLGIPFVLQWERRNIYRSIFISMVLCGVFFAVDTTSAYFAHHGYIDPLTAAWVAVLVFGPWAIALFDRMGT